MSRVQGSTCLKRRVYLGFDQGEHICHYLKWLVPQSMTVVITLKLACKQLWKSHEHTQGETVQAGETSCQEE